MTIGHSFADTLALWDEQSLAWFAKLEKTKAYSMGDRSMPSDMYKLLSDTLYNAFRHNLKSMVVDDDFYFQLAPKMQTQLVSLLF